MKKKLAYIPLVILWLMALYTVYVISTPATTITASTITITRVDIGYNHYIGFTFLIITTILFFINKNIAIISLGILLLAGCFNILQFLPSTSALAVGAKSYLAISFQPVLFVLFIFYIGINFRYLRSLFVNE